MMVCKHCGSEIPEGAVFCPNCSALAPTKRTRRRAERITPEKTVTEQQRRGLLYIGALLLHLLPIPLCFMHSFAITGTKSRLALSLMDTFIGGSSVAVVLFILCCIVSCGIFAWPLLKKNRLSWSLLIVPILTDVFGFLLFLTRLIRLSIFVGEAVHSGPTFGGWLFFLLCGALAVTQIVIFVKALLANKPRE